MDFGFSDKVKELQGTLLDFMENNVYPSEPVYFEQITSQDNVHEQPPIMRERPAGTSGCSRKTAS